MKDSEEMLDNLEEEGRCERAWQAQMEREEIEAAVRENGIRLAINQHICED